MKLSIKKGAALFGILAAAAAPAALAQGVTADQLGLSDDQLDALLGDVEAPKQAASPGISFGSPVAFGADWGDIGFGVGGATLPGNAGRDEDGSAGVVFGLGSANKSVGLEVTANIISITDDFAHDGNFGAKLHTTLPGDAAFAVGIENIGRWGRAKTTSSSVYAVGTKVFTIGASNMPLALNAGIGDNRFDDPGEDDVSPFGSIALLPIRQLSLIADWTGNALNGGVSVAPFDAIPLTVSLGATNLTERNGGSTEFSGGVGYSISF